LDELKQAGFYTDCFGEGSWSEPSKFVDEDVAAFVIKAARSLTKKYEFTEREIELWMEHVRSSKEAKPENLKKFWEAMIPEGLAQVSIDNIDHFLGIEPERQ